MTPLEYKQFCESTYACPPGTDREEYLRLLLIEELGEVASLFAKAMRDGAGTWVPCPHCGGGCTSECYECRTCKYIGYVEGPRVYGPKTVNRDALKKELGDVMWCAAMLDDVPCGDGWPTAPRQGLEVSMLDAIIDVHRELEDGGSPLYWACRAVTKLGFDPEEVATANVEKLRGRRERGTIHGAGDER
jgi:NTP pyrophosphatase (non-canonical NTP hydrolase)